MQNDKGEDSSVHKHGTDAVHFDNRDGNKLSPEE